MKGFLIVILGTALGASAFAAAFAPDAQSGAAARQAPAAPKSYGLGRLATADEIKKLDIDVMPDGRGLPAGRGTVAEGATIYAAKCRSCHGANGEAPRSIAWSAATRGRISVSQPTRSS